MSSLLLRYIVRNTHRPFCGCRKAVLLVIPLLVSFLLVWCIFLWLANVTSKALLPPSPPDQNLEHFRRSRSLAHYLDSVQVLIEPTSTPCTNVEEIPVIILVTSAPDNYNAREAVRKTWAQYQPTYFVMGLHGNELDELLVTNYIEAKQYSDMIVFDFHDHYQNLTIKTALIMQWTLSRCPQAQFIFKTDDDVLINPWTLKTVMMENRDAKILGYRINDTLVHRDEYVRWYVPHWLYAPDILPQYLSGTGYLISGEYVRQILKKALKVPLINLEDVYFTYLVAHKALKLTLTHDCRLSPYKPYPGLGCLYWSLASSHSHTPEEMLSSWSKIKKISDNKNRCDLVFSILPLLIVLCLLSLTCLWLMLPSQDQDFEHYRRSRNLTHYLDHIQLIIEPSSTPCETLQEVPLIIMVGSTPDRFEARQAVRQTWANTQPTYFVLGLEENDVNEQLVDNYIEAKQYGDMIIFDFRDHYQNLTLKSALMMHWTICRCPQVRWMLKTDDDVFINPWTLNKLLKDNKDAVILGHRRNDTPICHRWSSKWYIPSWLYEPDAVPQFLSGAAYLVDGKYLRNILKAAFQVPLINLEDVYFTYLVAHKNLGLSLTHDRRLTLYKPFFGISCVYWRLASAHSLAPNEMRSVWFKIKTIATRNDTCVLNVILNSDLILY